ncbi:carbohydrate ABC transporter permease [Polycladidibacter hongkongensis]|uniref:carbohydrate ABC transporter permease n=1 Tax=Polycladidibacter hongkongensis TaxID=1647556 RepID=UPI0009E7EA37|nr:ABC transporter permease subunit [Pseudovibrio hongkongensis]
MMIVPVVVLFSSSTHSGAVLANEGPQLLLGGRFLETYSAALFEGRGFSQEVNGLRMMLNSLLLAGAFAAGKTLVSMLAAFALVYFRVRFASFLFMGLLVSLMLPLESRFLAVYDVVATLDLVNTGAGVVLPLMASALGVFFFRQFLQTVPQELSEAARIDGAGPLRFFFGILLPASSPMVSALFLVLFVQGWNQYLWPQMVNSNETRITLVQGMALVGRQSPAGFALAVLALLPPVLLVLLCQRSFVKGLTDGRQ